MANANDTLFAHQMPSYIGSYSLTVRDLNTVSAFYQNAIGLSLINKQENVHILGVNNVPLLELHHNAKAVLASPHEAGLFHAAFLVPKRTDLAHFLMHLAQDQIPVDGASDHLVSEALYLSDPEGNGIEVYVDRPYEEWMFNKDGVMMDTLRLDIQGLLKESPAKKWSGIASGTRMGHMHLQVGSLNEAREFYSDTLRQKVMEDYPGAVFMASGLYHHHIATNIWNSKNADGITANQTGLRDFTIEFNDHGFYEGILDTLKTKGIDVTLNEKGHALLHDPWGIQIKLRTNQAPTSTG